MLIISSFLTLSPFFNQHWGIYRIVLSFVFVVILFLRNSITEGQTNNCTDQEHSLFVFFGFVSYFKAPRPVKKEIITGITTLIYYPHSVVGTLKLLTYVRIFHDIDHQEANSPKDANKHLTRSNLVFLVHSHSVNQCPPSCEKL